MADLGPAELAVCLIPVAIVAVIVLIVVRRTPAKAAEPSPQPVAQAGAEETPGTDAGTTYASTEATSAPLNGLAQASLVLGLIVIPVHFLLGLTWSGWVGPIAAILGLVALIQIRRQGGRGKGLAIAGILLGALPLILTTCALLAVTLSAPGK